MKSFPTSFIKDDLVQPGKIASANLKTTLKNLAGSIMNNALGGSEVSKESLGERLTQTWLGFDYDTSINEANYTADRKNYESTNYHLYENTINGVYHENARKIPALTLASINRYRQIYKLTATQVMDGIRTDKSNSDSSYYFEYYSEVVSPSLFDGKFGVRSQGMTVNTPLMTSASINYNSDSNNDSNDSEDGANTTSNDDSTEQLIALYEGEIKEIQQQIALINNQMSSTDISKEMSPEDKANINANYANMNARLDQLNEQIKLLKNDEDSDNSYSSYVNDDLANINSEYPSTLVDDSLSNSNIFVQLNNDDFDFTDCSIKTLVRLSNGLDSSGGESKRRNYRSLGRATYRYADFMFCKDLGKVSNNHLITLRKFITPIGDNIFKSATKSSDKEIPSTAKLISWFGTDDNKLEDICKYDYEASWKELNAKIEDVQSKEDNSKVLPSLVNMLNPSYNKGVAAGIWGGNNFFYQKIAAHSGGLLQAQGTYENDYGDFYYKDQNKVYEPKNTIQSTHTYEGKLKFTQEFTLNFSYKLRSYDGINPKSAFLDLIGNILNVTYKEGKFWGGSRRWLGAPRNQAGWNRMNQIFDKINKGAHSGLEALFGCSSLDDLTSLVGDAFQALSGLVSQAKDTITGAAKDGSLAAAGKKAAHGAIDVLGGMLRNQLGRPAVYAMDSLLSGSNVGLWHLTIGNPRNPIMAMGNLIMTVASIQHSGPLGIDDFPTELRVTVKLKHARPRDAKAIAEMYTCGQGGLILPLNKKRFEKYYDISDIKNLEALGVGGYPDDEESREEAIKAISENWIR